ARSVNNIFKVFVSRYRAVLFPPYRLHLKPDARHVKINGACPHQVKQYYPHGHNATPDANHNLATAIAPVVYCAGCAYLNLNALIIYLTTLRKSNRRKNLVDLDQSLLKSLVLRDLTLAL